MMIARLLLYVGYIYSLLLLLVPVFDASYQVTASGTLGPTPLCLVLSTLSISRGKQRVKKHTGYCCKYKYVGIEVRERGGGGGGREIMCRESRRNTVVTVAKCK